MAERFQACAFFDWSLRVDFSTVSCPFLKDQLRLQKVAIVCTWCVATIIVISNFLFNSLIICKTSLLELASR